LLDVAILGQVALGYSPFIDRNRTVAATRLSVVPLRPDAALDVAQLLHAVGDVWPASGGSVSLNVVSESLLHDLLQASPSTNLMVEVPNFMASDPASTDDLVRLHGNGNTLLLKGRPNAPLPREVLPCFKYSIIDLADDRRITEATATASAPPPAGVMRTIAHVQSGRSNRSPRWRRASRAVPTPSSAGRSTTPSAPRRRAPARRARSPTCRSSSS
jgi:EAL and modified HD-GYP domain-containing signal transduction protein